MFIGTEIPVTSISAPVCNLANSMWSGKFLKAIQLSLFINFYNTDIELKVNGVLLSSRNGLHGYMSYMTRAYLTSSAWINSHEIPEMIYLPTPNKFDSLVIADDNPSFKHRRDMFRSSKKKRYFTPQVLTSFILTSF